MSVLKIKDETGVWQSVTVIMGENGKDGIDGKDGRSAYEVAVDNGFEGSEKEWLDSLKSTATDTDLSDYYTKAEVDAAIENVTVDIGNIDLSEYAKLEGEILDTVLENKGITKIEAALPTLITYDGYSMIYADGSSGAELFVNVSGTNLLNDYKNMEPVRTYGSNVLDYFIMGGGDPETQQKVTDENDENYGRYLIPISVYNVDKAGVPLGESTTYNLYLEQGLDATHYVRFTSNALFVQECGLDDVLSAYNNSYLKCVSNYTEKPDEWLSNVLQAADDIYRNGTIKGDDGLSAYEVYVKNVEVVEPGIRKVNVDDVPIQEIGYQFINAYPENIIRASIDMDAFATLTNQYLASETALVRTVTRENRVTGKTDYLDCCYFDLFYFGEDPSTPRVGDLFLKFSYEPYGAYSDMAYTWRIYVEEVVDWNDYIHTTWSSGQFVSNVDSAYIKVGTTFEQISAICLTQIGSVENKKVISITNPFKFRTSYDFPDRYSNILHENDIELVEKIAETIHLNVGGKNIMTEEEWLESLKGGGSSGSSGSGYQLAYDTEINTGKKNFDGKPIYLRIFHNDALTEAPEGNYDHSVNNVEVENIKNIIEISAVWHRIDNGQVIHGNYTEYYNPLSGTTVAAVVNNFNSYIFWKSIWTTCQLGSTDGTVDIGIFRGKNMYYYDCDFYLYYTKKI
jgi:hypothetical protein